MIDDPHPQETVPPAGTVATQPTAPAETPAGETAGAETPGAETPRAETPAAETVAVLTPEAETPGAETPEAETPGIETARAETAGAETLATGTLEAETPGAETPGTQAPDAEAQAAGAPEAKTPDAETRAEEALAAGVQAAAAAETQTTGASDAGAAEDATPPKPGPLREPDEDSLRLAEALVFASAEPVTPRGLARVLPDDIDADAVLRGLRARYAGRGVELVEAGNGVMFRSALDLAPRLRKVIDAPRRLPRVAMETLAIVAYHQPMTRPEIEHIRGTALSQQTLDSLLELNLIAPKGRRETPGRPTLWGTTPEFLAHFGLKDLRELPRREDLLLETAPPRATPEAIPADLQPPTDRAPERAAEGVPEGVAEPASERPPEPG
jgi:segregation and condensation protein B